MYGIEQFRPIWHLYRRMRHDSQLLGQVRDAMRRSIRNLENLRIIRPDNDPEVARLLNELRTSIGNHEESGTLASR